MRRLVWLTLFVLGALVGRGLTPTVQRVEFRDLSLTRALFPQLEAAYVPSVLKSIQSGTISLANVTSATATITSVGPTNTLVIYNGTAVAYASNISPSRAQSSVVLTNATTVTATRATSSSDAITVAFTALEFRPGVLRSLQRGTITMTGATPVTATITSVNTAKSSCLLGGWTSNGDNSSPTGENFMQCVLTNATTVTASKGLAGGAYTDILAYQVPEFP